MHGLQHSLRLLRERCIKNMVQQGHHLLDKIRRNTIMARNYDDTSEADFQEAYDEILSLNNKVVQLQNESRDAKRWFRLLNDSAKARAAGKTIPPDAYDAADRLEEWAYSSD